MLTITTIGQAKLAAAASGGPLLKLAQIAIGDTDGSLLTAASTALGHELYRAAVSQQGAGGGILNVSAIIPAVVGGFTLREVGVFDLDGDLIACGLFPALYKPLPTEDYAREITLNIGLAVNPALTLIALKELDLNAADARFARSDLANVSQEALIEKLGLLPEVIICAHGGAFGLSDGSILNCNGDF